VGKKVYVPTDANEATLEAKRLEVENELKRITREAENFFTSASSSDHGK